MALDCGVGPGTHLFTKLRLLGWKNGSKRDPILKPKLALGGAGTTYFHPWADKIAQEALEGAQGDPKGTIFEEIGPTQSPKMYRNLKLVAKISKWGRNLKESASTNWR